MPAVKSKPTKKMAEPAKKSKKAPPKKVVEEESSEEESDSDEEMASAPPVKAVKKPAKMEVDEDDSDEDASSEEEEVIKPAKKGKAAAKAPAAKPKKAAPPPVAEDSDDDDDESEDDSSEEEEKPAKKRKAEAKAPAPKAKKAKKETPPAAKDSDDEEEDDDSEDDSDSEETPANGKKVEEAESDDDDDEEDDSDKKVKESESEAKKVTLYIGNVKPEVEEKHLLKFFKKNGIAVAAVRRFEGKRFGHVDLENASDLAKALALNGQELKGDALKIEESKAPGTPRTPSAGGGGDGQPKKLYIKNVGEGVTEDMLDKLFPGSCDVFIPKRDGVPKGFAYIQFDDPSAVDKYIKDKQGVELAGESLFLDVATPKPGMTPRGGRGGGFGRGGGGRGGGERRSFGDRQEPAAGETSTIIVKNLSYDTTEDGLGSYFTNTTRCKILMDRDTGRSRGMAFISFGSPSEATEAYKSTNNSDIDGRSVMVGYANDFGSSPAGGGRGGGFGGGGRGRGGFGDRRGGFGDRGRGRGGFDRRGGGRGGGASAAHKGSIQDFAGKKKKFNDDD